MLTRDDSSQRRAGMLQEMHFRYLKKKILQARSEFRFMILTSYFVFLNRNITQRSVLQKRTEEAARHLEQTRLHSSHVYTEEFSVTEDLMGLAIGAHGTNIQQV